MLKTIMFGLMLVGAAAATPASAAMHGHGGGHGVDMVGSTVALAASMAVLHVAATSMAGVASLADITADMVMVGVRGRC
jgi:hypothetical protein